MPPCRQQIWLGKCCGGRVFALRDASASAAKRSCCTNFEWELHGAAAVILENLVDGPARCGDDLRVGLEVIRGGDKGYGQGPTSASRPGGAVDGQCRAEDLAGFGGEVVPSDHEVAGGVAGGQRAKVDDGSEFAIFHQQVPWSEVRVNRNGVTNVWRRIEGRLPCRGDLRDVQFAFEGCDGSPDIGVSVRQWATSVAGGSGCLRCKVQTVQLRYECGEVERSCFRIVDSRASIAFCPSSHA